LIITDYGKPYHYDNSIMNGKYFTVPDDRIGVGQKHDYIAARYPVAQSENDKLGP
jgi:hypothetical protein